jgi:hypothetical protein
LISAEIAARVRSVALVKSQQPAAARCQRLAQSGPIGQPMPSWEILVVSDRQKVAFYPEVLALTKFLRPGFMDQVGEEVRYA